MQKSRIETFWDNPTLPRDPRELILEGSETQSIICFNHDYIGRNTLPIVSLSKSINFDFLLFLFYIDNMDTR